MERAYKEKQQTETLMRLEKERWFQLSPEFELNKTWWDNKVVNY